MHYARADGSTFGVGSNDDTLANFAQPEGDFLLVCATISGSAGLQRGDAKVVTEPSAGLLVVDGTRPITSVSHEHSAITLTIPRERAAVALGGKLDFLGDGLMSLPSNGMAHLLTSHLHAMAAEVERLDGGSVETATKVAIDMALAALAQLHDSDDEGPAADHGEALFAAALRYIHLHCAAHDLTSAKVAGAIGCSRTHLYRVFSSKGRSVGEMIREARLRQAATMLVASPNIPIQLVAHHCGYGNPASFTRAFSARTGMTPGEYRDIHRRRPVAIDDGG